MNTGIFAKTRCLLTVLPVLGFMLCPTAGLSEADETLLLTPEGKTPAVTLKMEKDGLILEAAGVRPEACSATALANPSRLVLDIAQTVTVPRRIPAPSGTYPLLSVRLGRHPDKARIVLDFAGDTPAFEITHSGDGCSLSTVPTNSQPAAAAASTDAAQAPAGPAEAEREEIASQAAPAGAKLEPRENSSKEQTSSAESRDISLGFAVDRVYVRLASGGRPVENLLVKNTSGSPLSLSANAMKVEDAGQPNEKKSQTTELLVSPKYFSLDPGEQRAVRIVLRSRPQQTEAIYRVNLVPAGESFTQQTVRMSVGGEDSFNAVMGLGVLVAAEPSVTRAALSWKRDGDSLIFRNDGNVNVLLDKIYLCLEEEARCISLPTSRLYPERTLVLKVPPASSLRFLKWIGGDFEQVAISPESKLKE